MGTKTYRYYIKTNNNVIASLGRTSRLPNNVTEITQAQYDNYKTILASIPNRAGYTKKVTLYVDGTYDVEYTEIVEVTEEGEE